MKVDLGDKTVELKELWTLAKKMLLAFERGGWEVGSVKEKKRYDKERAVLEYLVRNRQQGAISAISQHYKDKLEIPEEPSGGETMYFLDQRQVVQHFFHKWGGGRRTQ
mmetsp:Transcript_10195/g.22617  ORF Transcript_10195/g.22617 Transcript_10195/m.22617 type:complete len:108 (-) Transcript_10195:109-432(-)